MNAESASCAERIRKIKRDISSLHLEILEIKVQALNYRQIQALYTMCVEMGWFE